MGVRYDRLFHMMIDQRITNSQLMKNNIRQLSIVLRY